MIISIYYLMCSMTHLIKGPTLRHHTRDQHSHSLILYNTLSPYIKVNVHLNFDWILQGRKLKLQNVVISETNFSDTNTKLFSFFIFTDCYRPLTCSDESLDWLNTYESCGQSYKHFTLINYDSRVIPDWKIPHITTLES